MQRKHTIFKAAYITKRKGFGRKPEGRANCLQSKAKEILNIYWIGTASKLMESVNDVSVRLLLLENIATAIRSGEIKDELLVKFNEKLLRLWGMAMA